MGHFAMVSGRLIVISTDDDIAVIVRLRVQRPLGLRLGYRERHPGRNRTVAYLGSLSDSGHLFHEQDAWDDG